MAPSPAAGAIRDRFASAMDVPHSLVEVSHREVGIEVRGTAATLALSSVCALDLEAMPSLRAGVSRLNSSARTRFNFDIKEALSTVDRACAVWERLVREHPTVPGFQNDLAVAQFLRAS